MNKEQVDLVEIVASVVDDADFEARPLGKHVKMQGDGSCMVDGNEPCSEARSKMCFETPCDIQKKARP